MGPFPITLQVSTSYHAPAHWFTPSPAPLIQSYRVSRSQTLVYRSASFPGLLRLQFLIACSMAWERG